MHGRRSLLVCALASALLAASSLLPLGPFEVFELKTLDLRFRLRERWRSQPVEPRVQTVLFDDRSLAALSHWPLPYAAYASAVANLRAAGTRVLGIDVLLAPADTSLQREAESYRQLVAQVHETPGTVLAVAPPTGSTGPGPASRLDLAPVDETQAYPWPCQREGRPGAVLLSSQELPALDLAVVVERIGQAELVRDEDGVVRRVPLVREQGEYCYPSFALQVACADLGVEPRDVRRRPGEIELWRGDEILRRIPVDGDGCMLVNYRDRERDVEVPLALVDVASPDGKAAAAGLAGRVVLLGSTARAFGDFHSTPLRPQVGDVEVFASAIETIVSGNFLKPAARLGQFFVSWAFLLAGAVFMVRLPPWRGVLLGLGLMALYVVFEKICFIWGGLWLDFIGPMAALQSAVVGFPLWSYRARSQRMLDEMAGLRHFDDLILSTMTSGVLLADGSGRVVKSSARSPRLLGVAPGTLEGRSLCELFAASPRALTAIEAAMQPPEKPAHGPACSLPVHVPALVPDPSADGDRLLDLSISVLDAATHRRRRPERHYLLTFADVTEHVRILQDDERRARLAAVGEIAAKLGHEIRNSLGGLRLYVENVREEIDPKSPACRTIDSMVEEIESLYRKIDELREYARDPMLEPAECDLKQLVEEALVFAGQKLRDKRIQVLIESPPHLDPVWVDRRQMRSAFQNLIHNAVEAAPDGGSLRIGLERSVGANGVPAGSHLVHFEDDGPGIPEEIGEQVFSLFFTTKAEAGTGLGLPIVKKIIESHGGRLQYTSRPGCTRFTVVLPPARHAEAAS